MEPPTKDARQACFLASSSAECFRIWVACLGLAQVRPRRTPTCQFLLLGLLTLYPVRRDDRSVLNYHHRTEFIRCNISFGRISAAAIYMHRTRLLFAQVRDPGVLACFFHRSLSCSFRSPMKHVHDKTGGQDEAPVRVGEHLHDLDPRPAQ